MHRQMERLSVLLKRPPVPNTQMRPADHPHRANGEMTDDGIAVVDELAERRVVRGPVRQRAHVALRQLQRSAASTYCMIYRAETRPERRSRVNGIRRLAP